MGWGSSQQRFWANHERRTYPYRLPRGLDYRAPSRKYADEVDDTDRFLVHDGAQSMGDRARR
eukprot:1796641-Pyramimonas_sp.AAC.1